MKRSTHFLDERGGRNCWILFFLCLFSCSTAYCQFTNTANAVSEGIAGASVAIPDHNYAIQSVASGAYAEETILSSSYKNYYLLPEVHAVSIQALVPVKSWILGIAGQKMGPQHFQELQTSVSIAHRINHTALGFRVHWNQLVAEGFNTQHALLFEFGGITKLNPRLNFGASVYNFTLSRFEQKTLPVVLRCGLSGQANADLLLCIEATKNIYEPLSLKAGALYQLHNRFKLSIGYTYPSSTIHGGFIALYRNFNFCYSTAWQIRIGISQNFSIAYTLKKHTL